jgi:hypothetical protein
MIEVRYRGRLGNNLFQYCLGRILAEKLGFALRAEPIPGFPNTADLVSGLCHKVPEQVLTNQRIDLDGTLGDMTARRVVLDGFFQRHEYYRPHHAKIRNWLAFDPSIQLSPSKPDVVVNVRRTDYVQLGWALPFSYYAEALERVLPKGGKVWIVTEDREDPFFQNFSKWRPHFYSGTPLEQIRFMAAAPRLVLSQSSFSWWATFLGDQDQVISPVPTFGCWSERGVTGDGLIERDRFICIECRDVYQPTKAETRYQKRRLRWRRLVLGLNRRLKLSLREPLE